MSLSPDFTCGYGWSPYQDAPPQKTEDHVSGVLVCNEPKQPAVDLILRYVGGIPYRRHLSRSLTTQFIHKIWELLHEVATTEPQFFEELASDLVRRIPRSDSRTRLILAETIKSVLEDLNIFHSRKNVFGALPAAWDVIDPDDQTPERQLDFEEQVHNLREALNAVDHRSARMLRSHYLEGKTMTEIGREVGLSKQRVSEIMAAARPLVAALYTIRASR